jgi:hypothetical protein
MHKKIFHFLSIFIMISLCLELSGCSFKPFQSTKSKAKDILIQQLQYWTVSDDWNVNLALIHANAKFRITYLSPQLIESAIAYKLKMDNSSNLSATELRDEVLRRLKTSDRIPFIFTISLASDMESSALQTDLGNALILYDTKGNEFSPMGYDRIFDGQLRDGTYHGYVYFPYSAIDLENASSFSIRLVSGSITAYIYSSKLPSPDLG